MALTALKGKPIKRKKAPAARRKLSGAAAAPMNDYNKCRDFFHFEVDNKDCAVIIKAYVKRVFEKEKARLILKNKEYTLYRLYFVGKTSRSSGNCFKSCSSFF